MIAPSKKKNKFHMPGLSRPRGHRRPSRMGLIAFVILIAIQLIYLIEVKTLLLLSVASQVLSKDANDYKGLQDPSVSEDSTERMIHEHVSVNSLTPATVETQPSVKTRSTTVQDLHATLDYESSNSTKVSNILPPLATILGTRVSYVTSFWAKVKGEKENPHRREVEAALLANIHNWHFDQVVVFLDRTEDAESCVDFHQRILDLSHEFLGTSKSRANELLAKKLQCVDVQTGQPTYYEMFQNALSDVVTGDVVVMSNGDIAFDDTVSLARHMNPEVLMVLGTSGFSNAMPHNVRQVYESMMGTDYMTNEELQKDHPASSWEINRCVRTASSWDTWIFHKNKLQGRLKEEYFQRLRLDDEMAFFYMNENGAENAALWAIEQAYRFSSSYNACDRIQSWHFHLTPKMHKVRETLWRGNKGKVFNIQKPWGFAPKNPDCFRTGSCFLKLE